MVKWAAIIWVIGLLTIVPYGIYDLLFHAPRDEYAFIITLVLFWIFGYWTLAGPLISAFKVRQVFKAMEQAQSKAELKQILLSKKSQEIFIEQLATENKIPKFIARKLVAAVIKKMPEQGMN